MPWCKGEAGDARPPASHRAALEANLNVTEMCQAAIDIHAVSSLPLILDGACGYGDPMHMHRTIGMSEAAGFAAIEIEDQLVPKRAHHHVGGSLGYKIVADPSTPLLAAYAAWQKVYAELAHGFGASVDAKPDWGAHNTVNR